MTPIGLHQMATDNQKWHLINNSLPIIDATIPIAITEHGGTLYIVTDDVVIASKDKGKTWKPLGPRPEGHAIGLIVKDNANGSIELYLALLQGMFHSKDIGVSWTPLNKGLAKRKIYAITSIENALFAGTNRGLFRLNLNSQSVDDLDKSGVWEQLPVAESISIHAFAVSEHRIYVVAGRLKITADIDVLDIGAIAKAVLSKQPLWTVFRTTDQGDSWIDITPTKVLKNKTSASIRIFAEGKTVMLLIEPDTIRSTDEGKTWITTPLGKLTGQVVIAALKAKSHSEFAHQDQFYLGDQNGIRRSTDGGNSWKRFNAGLGGNIQNLTILNNKLYAVAGGQLITSTDRGQSWKAIPVDLSGINITIMNTKVPLTKANIREITEANGIIYAKGHAGLRMLLFYLDEENRILLPIEGVPAFGESNPFVTLMKAAHKSMEESRKEETGKNAGNFMKDFLSMGVDIFGGFAVNENTFYVEYKRKLFIWSPSPQREDDTAWYDTKIEDTREFANLTSYSGFTGFKFGVSGDTVYVGKSDGVLLHSVDRGRNWRTVSLPIPVDSFKQILIVDETVYVTTDNGAMYSNDGYNWNTITDTDGQQLIFDRFSLDGTTIYAVNSSKNTQGGVYRLTSADSTWERITPEIPDTATSVVVAGNTLYVGTENGGLQLIALEDYSHNSQIKETN